MKIKKRKPPMSTAIETETEPEAVDVDEETKVQAAMQCAAWCFLPGLGIIGTIVPQCQLMEGHEESEHQFVLEMFIPPKGKFTIRWTHEP